MVPRISSTPGPPTKQVLVAKSPNSGQGNENLHEVTLQGGSQQSREPEGYSYGILGSEDSSSLPPAQISGSYMTLMATVTLPITSPSTSLRRQVTHYQLVLDKFSEGSAGE